MGKGRKRAIVLINDEKIFSLNELIRSSKQRISYFETEIPYLYQFRPIKLKLFDVISMLYFVISMLYFSVKKLPKRRRIQKICTFNVDEIDTMRVNLNML